MKATIYYVLFLFSVYATAQTGTIKGQVIDQQSGMPLPGVTIELLNQEVAKGVILAYSALVIVKFQFILFFFYKNNFFLYPCTKTILFFCVTKIQLLYII